MENVFIFQFDKAKKEKVKKVIDNSKIITSLRKNAQSLINQAEKINTEVSGNWTYRRQSFADSASRKKDRLLQKAKAISNLADLWEMNECPEVLKYVRNANDFDVHYPTPPDNDCPIGGWYRERYPKDKKAADRLGITSKDVQQAFKDAIDKLSVFVLSEDEIRERKLKRALIKVRSYNIEGFFPTPDDVIDKMIDYAQLDDGMSLLEPSAGIGSIVDRVKERGFNPTIFCVEQQHSLFEIIRLKGYENIACADILTDPFLNIEREDLEVERILMNPPFEKGQDIDHVLHCYNKFLKPNGRLISVMSAGVMFNTNKKYVDFREWVDNNGGEIIDLGQAFKGAFNSTGVSTILLVIDK